MKLPSSNTTIVASRYLSQIFTAIPMLFHVNRYTTLTYLISGVSMCNVQIEIALLIKSMCHTNWCYIMTQILANKIFFHWYYAMDHNTSSFVCSYHVQTKFMEILFWGIQKTT